MASQRTQGWTTMLNLLQYPPVQRGLIALLLAGILFPQAGLAVIRLNLVPLRFMLIHGLLLGGALGLASGINPLISSLMINSLLVTLLVGLTRRLKGNYGYFSALFMVMSAALASWVIYRFDVPARETLFILWGSPFTVSKVELIALAALTVAILFLRIRYHRQLSALFFHPEIAQTAGVNEKAYTWVVVWLTALIVSFAMKLLGALLLDLLLLLPALAVSWTARSFKRASFWASIMGVLLSLSGFILALVLDIPVSTALALPVVFMVIIIVLLRRKK